MRTGILALESLDPEAAANAEAAETEFAETEALGAAETELADVEPAGDDFEGDLDSADAGVETAEDVVAEGEAIDETLGGINENLEASVADGGEGVGPDAAEALQVATEYFRKRLQADKTELVYPGFESHAAGAASYTRAVIAHNQGLQRGISRGMVYAQEGVGDKIANAASVYFATANKMRKRALAASQAYDQGTVKTEAISGAFTKALNPDGKAELSAGDVVAVLKASANLVPASSIALIDKLSDQLARLKGTVNESWFAANKEQIAELQKLAEEVAENVTSIKAAAVKAQGTNKDAPIAPAQKGDKNKIVGTVNLLLNNDKLAKALEKFEKNASFFWTWYKNSYTRLAGGFAKDLRMTSSAVGHANSAIKAVQGAQRAQVKISHAAISYIEASVGKTLAKEEAGVTSAENPSIDPSTQKDGKGTTDGTGAGTADATADAAAKEKIEGKDITSQVTAAVKKAD